MKKKIYLVIFLAYNLTYILSAQTDNKLDYLKGIIMYADFNSSGIQNDSTAILMDTLNNFQIQLKANTIYKYSSTQLNVVNQDSTGISYLLIFGVDGKQYRSLARFWDKKFSKVNSSFNVSNISQQNTEYDLIESADISVTTNQREMVGKMKTIQSGVDFYILQVMTFKDRFEDNENKIIEIVNSFNLLK